MPKKKTSKPHSWTLMIVECKKEIVSFMLSCDALVIIHDHWGQRCHGGRGYLDSSIVKYSTRTTALVLNRTHGHKVCTGWLNCYNIASIWLLLLTYSPRRQTGSVQWYKILTSQTKARKHSTVGQPLNRQQRCDITHSIVSVGWSAVVSVCPSVRGSQCWGPLQ